MFEKINVIFLKIMESIMLPKCPTVYKMNKTTNKTTLQRKTFTTVNMPEIEKCITYLLYENKWRTPRQSSCRNNCNTFIPAPITTQLHSSYINVIKRVKQHVPFRLTKQPFWLTFWLLVMLRQHVESFGMTTTTAHKIKGTETSADKPYSQLWYANGQVDMYYGAKFKNKDNAFHPLAFKDPEVISNNVVTPSGQFHVYRTIDTDLTSGGGSVQPKSQRYGKNKMTELLSTPLATENETNEKTREASTVQQKLSSYLSHTKHQQQHHNKVRKTHVLEHDHDPEYQKHKLKQPLHVKQNEMAKQDSLTTDFKSLEDLLVAYVTNFYQKGQYEPLPGLVVELQKNHSQEELSNKLVAKTRNIRQTAATDAKIRLDLPRTLATGRLLFLTGLKKVLWPVFMGLQVLKSLLIAMFIPALIGSFTKLLGKGITTGSAPLFIRPMEPPQELDFRDNSLNFEGDNKFVITDENIKNNGPYAYNQPDATQMNAEYGFEPSSANNQMSYIRLGMNERQHQLMQDSYMSALQSIGSASFKNSGSLSSGSSGLLAPMAKRPPPAANVNTFQQFQNVPDSSLLLSNYDPFYSPLLSRLDSVFAQLKLNSDKETCREKLICLMYANPAKYAPYSNLVSAQLSRELNELRKPTSDNPEILRFFKYMRAAKDGQDGADCAQTFDKCTEFKDIDNPVMVSTYNDINKLVQARNFNNK